jgi:hypothetical protein
LTREERALEFLRDGTVLMGSAGDKRRRGNDDKVKGEGGWRHVLRSKVQGQLFL